VSGPVERLPGKVNGARIGLWRGCWILPQNMRRIIAFDHVSADGYFATEDGKLDWVVPDEELAQFNLRNMAEADTLRFGHILFNRALRPQHSTQWLSARSREWCRPRSRETLEVSALPPCSTR
jgi:hypothetical protein